MSFRVRNTANVDTQPVNRVAEKPIKVYTQEEIDLIDAHYRERQERYKKMVETPNNGLLEQYRQNLISNEEPIVKEMIVFDQSIGKWKIIKEK